MKHTPGYNAGVEIPADILEKFEQEANLMVGTEEVYAEFKLQKPLNDKEKENMIKGYIISQIISYKRNNGVPPIPFPVSFSTVDMVCWSYKEGDNTSMVLLGRKPGQPKWQFPGGFRDPRETCKIAAARELNEECLLDLRNNVERFIPIQELFIDDVRYRHTPHKVTTSIFGIRLELDEMELARPGDDLGETRWFRISDLLLDNREIREIHLPIFNIFIQYLLSIEDTQKITVCRILE